MAFDIGAIFGQVVSLYARMPLAQKIALPFLFLGSMGVIVFVSRWASQPDYQTLYANLTDGDAGAVVEKLKDQKVSYRLTNDGKTIEISPPSMVHELRLELASAGIPKGGTFGFELFDKNLLGRTGFVERLTHQRALQGELERTIGSIDAVRNVRVHITTPERSSFVKKEVAPTASVLLRLKVGSELTAQQIKGISNLVASSVERLTPDNVRVIDSKGNLLNEKIEDKDAQGSGMAVTQLDYKQKLESGYAKQIETMLGGVLGPGKAIARVTADIDFSSFQKEEEAYDPGSKVARSERQVEEAAGLTAEGGVPGVISNLTNDNGALTPPDSSKNSNRRVEMVRNFEVSRAVSRTSSAPGKVQKLSVAVLVDGQYASEATGKKDASGQPVAAKQYKPLTSDMVQKIENLVKQSVGFDGSRGDIVTVENIRFFEPEENLAQQLDAAQTTDQAWRWASIGLPLLFVVLFFMVMFRMVSFLINPSEAETDLSRLLPAGVEELEAELDAERSKLSTSQASATQPTVDMEELEAVLAENSRIVKENPQQAALLIRYWLNEGRA